MQHLAGLSAIKKKAPKRKCNAKETVFLFRTWAERNAHGVNILICDVITELHGEPAHVTLTMGGSCCLPKGPLLLKCTPSLSHSSHSRFVTQNLSAENQAAYVCSSPKQFVASLWYYKGKITNRLWNEKWYFEESYAHQNQKWAQQTDFGMAKDKDVFTQERDTRWQKMQHIRVKRARTMK